MLGDKLRFRFSKTGTLRLLSHHDLMRCLERMLRRANLPFKSTAGFHPGPRVVFALSLPLGVLGLDEVVEIEFLQPLDDTEVLARLAKQAPAGLAFTRAAVVPMKTTALPRRIVYRLELPQERVEATADRCEELMAAAQVWVERLKPSPKRLNIRPYFRRLCVEPNPPTPFPPREGGFQSPSPRGGGVGEGSLLGPNPPTPFPPREGGFQSPSPRGGGVGEGSALQLGLWVTGTGTARADELLKLIGVADLLDTGAVIERTTVELRDEVPNLDPADVPPDGPAETQPLDSAAVAALVHADEEQPAAATWGASPAGPVVE